MMAVRQRSRALAPCFMALAPKNYFQCHRTVASLEKDILQAPAGPTLGRKRVIEKLWRDLFSNPSQWWDHRSYKENPRYPDFKHKKTQNGLWLIDSANPPWVEVQLAAMAPGTVQSNIFSWNKRLERYVKVGDCGKAMDLFQQMQREGINPDKVTFIRMLNACSSLQDLEQGRRIHLQIVQNGHESDDYVGSSLVNMYAKCGSIQDAWGVFSKMSTHSVVSWTALIQGYVKCEQGEKAIELFQQMLREGLELDPATFLGVLNACASLGALEEGKRVHEEIILRGYESDIFVGNSLLDMYAKCGSIEDAWRVFCKMPVRTVVSWSAMILGFVRCGQGQKALEVFQQLSEEGIKPNAGTFVGALNACASLAALEEGRRVHELVIQGGYEANIFVGSSLVDMYTKCGSVEDASRVFTSMPARNVVSWTAMILGYVKDGQGQKALELYRQMQGEGVEPDPLTFVGVLNACAGLVALDEGRSVHEQLIQRGHEAHVFVGNALVDMYAKCGSIQDAWRVFNKMPTRDVVSWNAMLGGCAMHGHSKEVLGLFEEMSQAGVKINEVSFVALLSACSHAGLVDEGLCYFETMRLVYHVPAIAEHYTCMVDLLGRAGHLHQAEALIQTTMSCEPDSCVWLSLLAACRVHGNVEMGEHAGNQVLNLEPEDAAGYVLLANVYSAAGE